MREESIFDKKDMDKLNLLLGASNKSVIEKIVNLVFATRHDSKDECVGVINTLLELDASTLDGSLLYDCLLECIATSLAEGQIEALAELFETSGSDINPKLKSLLGNIINSKLSQWREAAAFNRVSLPKLVEVDWALHMKSSSSVVAKMAVPSILVELSVQESSNNVFTIPDVNKVNLELSKEALETMLDGLGKIKDQLSLM